MKIFNILRPLIFLFCGLGYLPLQSADDSTAVREVASIQADQQQSEAKKIDSLSKKANSSISPKLN